MGAGESLRAPPAASRLEADLGPLDLMLIRVPRLSWRTRLAAPFPATSRISASPCWAKTTDSLRGALSGPGSRGGNQTPVDLELELFPCKGGCCQDISAPTAGLTASLMDHTVRAGWQVSPVLPSPPPVCSPGSQIHLTRVASSLAPFCLLPPLSLVFRELRGLLAKAIMTPCLPMILFKALAIPFSHLIWEAGRVGNDVLISQVTELRVALEK